ncbi:MULTISPECIES: mechanosensitive ion channel family protein [Coprobacillaceae]|uniref:mechanosensitive ion channel family protein n=1 Tax=Coprobacillaceae TaxID=2810280 RepID=UPI000E529FE9|nr:MULTISPECIES: mechanosensitive ion channel family protein [Coprobacillaceae]RHM60483.1 mechanosensitive ion channel family protein [Coprobacillus sp. AF33-1AC]RHS95816.1 mechanosensitive ion channel family protein [Erysipelatoclostridium sp. AM42-17]
MINIYNQIDGLFVNGMINGLMAILFASVIIFGINKLCNRFICKKWPENHNTQMRMKKTIIVFIMIAIISGEIKALSSLAKALLASGGILAVVIGLASQEAASNLINGLMVISYKPFKEGDFVHLPQQNISGKVIDVSLRHTVIETLEKTQVIIPNTIMNKEVIENISQVERTKANHLFVDIAYESDIDQAISIIQKLAEAHPLSIDGRTKAEKRKGAPKVAVHIIDFKDSGIALRATIHSKNNITGFNMLSDLRKEIIHEFNQAGIEIPYPHMEVINKE